MQGIGTHCVGASWMMHRLCWLCIFDFGLVRAFLNLGSSCWTNCLVLYSFVHKKRLLETKHSRWKILALSLYPPAILVCWHTGKSTCSPGFFGALESRRWTGQRRDRTEKGVGATLFLTPHRPRELFSVWAALSWSIGYTDILFSLRV